MKWKKSLIVRRDFTSTVRFKINGPDAQEDHQAFDAARCSIRPVLCATSVTRVASACARRHVRTPSKPERSHRPFPLQERTAERSESCSNVNGRHQIPCGRNRTLVGVGWRPSGIGGGCGGRRCVGWGKGHELTDAEGDPAAKIENLLLRLGLYLFIFSCSFELLISI